MPQNADQFLNIFNAVERHLQNKFNQGNFAPFRFLLRRAAAQDAIFRRYQDVLFAFGDLRNVLVHNDRFGGRAIAEPLDEVVKEFEEISELIEHPGKVEIFEKKVFYCFFNDTLDKALQLMLKHKITQIPVIDDTNIIEVLNGNHVAFWLADQSTVSPSQTRISQVLGNAEYKHNFKIIPCSMSVYDAAEMYRYSYLTEPKNRYFDALIITENGKPHEKMTGIIVLKDIAKYMTE
ncbi:MAG: CBS domain-containing protein [Bacteroidales bacterium]|jgi:predicted transcriptional regulator